MKIHFWEKVHTHIFPTPQQQQQQKQQQQLSHKHNECRIQSTKKNEIKTKRIYMKIIKELEKSTQKSTANLNTTKKIHVSFNRPFNLSKRASSRFVLFFSLFFFYQRELSLKWLKWWTIYSVVRYRQFRWQRSINHHDYTWKYDTKTHTHTNNFIISPLNEFDGSIFEPT